MEIPWVFTIINLPSRGHFAKRCFLNVIINTCGFTMWVSKHMVDKYYTFEEVKANVIIMKLSEPESYHWTVFTSLTSLSITCPAWRLGVSWGGRGSIRDQTNSQGLKRNICRMKVLPPLAPSPTVFWFGLGSNFAARLYLLFLIWDHKRKNTKK